MDKPGQNDYHFNLFQPLTDYGRRIRNLILIMLLIWAGGVFGFQILLRVLEKPVPEQALLDFNTAISNINQGSEETDDKLLFLKSLLMVAGKNVVKPSDRVILNSWITLSYSSLVSDSLLQQTLVRKSQLKMLKSGLVKSGNEDYNRLKEEIIQLENQFLEETSIVTGFTPKSLESVILVQSLDENFTPPMLIEDEAIQELSAIMNLYLTHNRSVLTDTPFLGFPFHYFYTAVFLLILFVGLCLVYNLRIDRRMKIEHINE